jgi:esterase/lipase
MSFPILLLHGALGSNTQLEPLKKILEQSRTDVYSMNFSGHSGESFSTAGFGVEIFANDVLRFLEKERIETADIFGYSMGGYVTLWLAHKHPFRVNQIFTLGTKFDWSPESAEREIKKMDHEKILEKIPAFARLLEHRHAPNDWKELINKTAHMMFDLGKNSLLTPEIISTISHKTKILLGDQDDMADRSYSEQVVKWLPKGEFQLLENTPHPIEKVDIRNLVKRLL